MRSGGGRFEWDVKRRGHMDCEWGSSVDYQRGTSLCPQTESFELFVDSDCTEREGENRRNAKFRRESRFNFGTKTRQYFDHVTRVISLFAVVNVVDQTI
jgi:hypothetical protein